MGTLNKAGDNSEQRARARRSAWLLGLVAIAFYLGFILMSVTRS